MIYHIERKVYDHEWVSLCKPTADLPLAKLIAKKHVGLIPGSTRVVKYFPKETHEVLMVCNGGEWKKS